MQHVALITTSYPEQNPGSEAAGSFVEDFASELSRHLRVTVIAAGKTDSVAESGQLSVRRFAVPRLPLSLLNPMVPSHWLLILKTLRAGRRATMNLAQVDKPDYLFALWALPSGYWAEQASRRYGLKFGVWALGSDIWSLGKVPLVRHVLKKVLRHAHRRYADGLKLAAAVENLAGLNCDFLPSVRRLPCSDSIEKRPGEGCRLAFLGRWHRNKGVDLLLGALRLLTNEDWSRIGEVRINGGGPLHDTVHAMVDELKRQNRPVAVGGYLDKQAAAALIRWADYLLLPSRIESIPVIFSDAMQLNTPIIATAVGDLRRLFEKYEFGVLVAKPTAQEFAGAIQSALRQNGAVYSDAINLAAKDFELSAIVQGFVEELESN